MTVNSYKDNDNLDTLEDVLKARDPDIISLLEVTDKIELKLKDFFAKYPYKMETYVRDGFRICLLSKTQLYNQDISLHGPSDSPLLSACFDHNGVTYSIFSAHPKPALSKSWDEERHIYFKETEKVIANAKHPKIIMGDFNSVPWEEHFEVFLKNTEVTSTLVDVGYKVTWPVYCPLMGIPMDHILVSDSSHFGNLKVGPYDGSDHYPISIDILKS